MENRLLRGNHNHLPAGWPTRHPVVSLQ